MSVSLLALPIFVFGMVIGSFLNVVALRTVSGKSSTMARSECMHCQSTINWFDNIPIFFSILKGSAVLVIKAFHCNTRSLSLLQELFHFLLYSIHRFTASIHFFNFICHAHSYFGNRYSRKINISIHLYILFALVIVFRIFVEPIGSLTDLFYGPLAFGGFLAILRWVGGKIYKKEAMGIGDVKLAVVLGFMLNLKFALVALYTSFISASIVGVYLIASKRKSERILPFAPFLSFGAMMAYFYGLQIISFVVQF